MRVVIVGAGSVGRSIARELTAKGHEVLLIDRDQNAIKPHRVPEARWLLADACEMDRLGGAGLPECDVLVAATGDDKSNLVVSLLGKTEFGVPRTVARVNNPRNRRHFELLGIKPAVSATRAPPGPCQVTGTSSRLPPGGGASSKELRVPMITMSGSSQAS